MIITVTNRKGGVGKSTMSVHAAAGLAALGWRVGLVDTDSQGHAGLMLNMPERDGLFEVMVEKQPLRDVVTVVPPEAYSTPDRPAGGLLALLPSSVKTYKIPFELGPSETFLFLDVMDGFKEDFNLDVVVVDTNPTMSMFDGAIYLATDGFVYVTECEALSFDGVGSAVGQMLNFQKTRQRHLGRQTRVLGILPNKMRARTTLHRHNIQLLADQYPGMVWNPIRLHTAWTEATNARETIFTWAPSGTEAKAAWGMVERLARAVEYAQA